MTLCAAILACAATARAKDPIPPELAAFFKADAEAIAARPLMDAKSADDWNARRPEHQRQLREMLGLDPMPPRTDLKAEIKGVVERPDFVIERILYQSSPGLYVTANLYRPKVVEKPLPAVLYVCGHAKVEKDGVIYGCKAHYQHHAAWFAANGYVCLVVDTLQLGEVPGVHHGVLRMGRWWWQSRGYTPAGVEVWNGIRGLDYLCSRPEVDPERLGVTGRSGGGAMSWYLGAVDDRLKVVVPVAGITDLSDHIVAGAPGGPHPDGVIDGHCDCMYFVNTYRWDYTMLAALVAPKALLVENTDADPIFPEAGVRRIHKQLETVYGWLGVPDRLDLVIGKGGHVDTPEIRHPAFAWFEKHFKGDAARDLDAIQEPDRAVPIELLKVLEPGEPLPANLNDTIDETFIPRAVAPEPTSEAWEAAYGSIRADVLAKTFAAPGPDWRAAGSTSIEKAGLVLTTHDVDAKAHPGLRQRVWTFHAAGRPGTGALELIVMTADDWKRYAPLIDAFEGDADPSGLPEFAALKAKADSGARTALLAPRGIGRTAWPESRDVSIRRRFAMVGRTLDSWRVGEVRDALRGLGPADGSPSTVVARGDAAAVALWASIFAGRPTRLVLQSPPATVRDGPAFLNLDRFLDMPQVVAATYPADARIESSPPSAWSWTRTLAERLGAAKPWPEIVP
jgi:dienelactone hydrolase